MNVTDEEIKYSQTQENESSLQKDSAEHESYVGGYNSSRITENNMADANMSEERLLEEILSRENMNKAYKKVKSNKGSHGVDGMKVDDLLKYLVDNREEIKQAIKDGKYRPNPVRRVEIPKDDGKVRPLGIPTVVDRVIQQTIAQVLTPIFEKQFSDSSYGFRPKRSVHDAIRKSQNHVEEGYEYVVDMDLEKYFDTVNQSKLMEILSRTIKDGRVISLIHKYLKAGVIIKHSMQQA